MAQRRDLLSQIGANKRRNVSASGVRGPHHWCVAFDLLFRFGAAFIVVAFVIAIGLVWASSFYSDRLPVLGDAS